MIYLWVDVVSLYLYFPFPYFLCDHRRADEINEIRRILSFGEIKP